MTRPSRLSALASIGGDRPPKMNIAKKYMSGAASSPGSETHVPALQRALEDERRRTDALNRIATAIGSSGDLESVVQAVVDGGVELSGAEFGAFFKRDVEAGERDMLYAVSGAPRSAFEAFPVPINAGAFEPTPYGKGVVRCDDVTADPRYRTPPGHLAMRSYLAAPVIAAHSGEVLGGLLFGHSQVGVFPERMEMVVTGLAAQAAVAIENVLLTDAAQRDADSEASTRARLRFALESGRLGSWELDFETRAYEASDLCKANYGRGPDEPFTYDDLIASIHPDDRGRMQRAIEEAIRTGAEYDIEYRINYPSGETHWLHARGRAAQTADHGGVRRMAGVSLDVTERKRAEERQRLLLNELNHRVKNTLATVQSIAWQTLRTTANAEKFRDSFESRLMALSQTHNLLTDQNWEAASLRDILVMELTPHAGGRDGGGSRLMIDIDHDVRLSPKAAVAIGMALHELATNAVKYGALSTATGRVTVRANVDGATDARRLGVEWIESGGPVVARPSRRGFGARLLEEGLAGELAGTVTLDYRPDGLVCRMDLPLKALEPTE
jgi:PAS domain S-box-containing protein